MFNNLFKGIFDTETLAVIDVTDFLLCIACALICGIILAVGYIFKSKYTKNFVITLAVLPAVVCVVIMMVNGNIGAGVAVAGAFSLVRFRSVPGTAREIGAIFLAMGTGLVCGMGYLGFAALFAVILGVALLLYTLSGFGKPNTKARFLRITIPEDLNYTEAFDEVFEQYTTHHRLVHTKTVNLGSMFNLRYELILKDASKEKEFIDALRVRNGNLEVTLTLDREDGFGEL
jgi:hypothetical protein